MRSRQPLSRRPVSLLWWVLTSVTYPDRRRPLGRVDVLFEFGAELLDLLLGFLEAEVDWSSQ